MFTSASQRETRNPAAEQIVDPVLRHPAVRAASTCGPALLLPRRPQSAASVGPRAQVSRLSGRVRNSHPRRYRSSREFLPFPTSRQFRETFFPVSMSRFEVACGLSSQMNVVSQQTVEVLEEDRLLVVAPLEALDASTLGAL